MFRIVHAGASLPASFICDPSAEFQPGMVAELAVIGNQVMATVSNGTAPLGIIDDIKTRAFTNVSWNETIITPAIGVLNGNNQLVTPIDVKAELQHAAIVKSSFTSTVDVVLNTNNGVITFVAGTLLNFDLVGSGTPNAIKTIVNYTYYIPNIPGDDSTQGSGRVTVWYQRMIFQTDQFETNQQYPVRANVYVSENGFLTTRKPSATHPAIGMITAPPSPMISTVEVLYF